MAPFAESWRLQPHHPTRGSQQELRLLLFSERSDGLFFSFEGSIHSQLPEPRLPTGMKALANKDDVGSAPCKLLPAKRHPKQAPYLEYPFELH